MWLGSRWALLRKAVAWVALGFAAQSCGLGRAGLCYAKLWLGFL